MGPTAVVPGGSRLATDQMTLRSFYQHLSVLLARVAYGCAVWPVAFAQVVPEVDVAESNPARLILRDNAPVALKTVAEPSCISSEFCDMFFDFTTANHP